MKVTTQVNRERTTGNTYVSVVADVSGIADADAAARRWYSEHFHPAFDVLASKLPQLKPAKTLEAKLAKLGEQRLREQANLLAIDSEKTGDLVEQEIRRHVCQDRLKAIDRAIEETQTEFAKAKRVACDALQELADEVHGKLRTAWAKERQQAEERLRSKAEAELATLGMGYRLGQFLSGQQDKLRSILGMPAVDQLLKAS